MITIDQKNRGKSGQDYRYMFTGRASVLLGVAVSLLIHSIGLWLLIDNAPLLLKEKTSVTDGRVTISLAPQPAIPSAQKQVQPPALPEKKKQTPPVIAKRKPLEKLAKDSDRELQNVLKPLPSALQVAPSLPDDMSTQLEAARKRRADAIGQDGGPESGSAPSASEAAQNDNSIALANIAFSQKRAKQADRDDVGGLFQVRRVGYRDAEFVFQGWSARSRRNSTRLITVEQKAEADIQTAMVKKMVEIIREEKKDDFLWESNRLGKTITLSARPRDNAELEQFLLREIFPTYSSSAPRG